VLPERGELAPRLQDAGAEVVIHPLSVLRRSLLSPTGLLSLAGTARLDARALASLARERGAAMVHSNTSVIVAGQAVARHAGIPHVQHVREIYAGAPAGRLWPLWRRRLERSDALVCVSRATADQFGARGEVLHDGLPRVPRRAGRDQSRKALGLAGDRFVVAVLGRVSDWKGQDVLAHALAQPPLAEIGAVGLVAGDAFPGEERHERALAELAAGLGLGERLRMLGFREDLETVLGAADAVAVPSTRPDPLPNSALEAAAAGLPVVGAAHGGIPEILGPGGLLTPPGDARALAECLRRVADHPPATDAVAADVRERFAPGRLLSGLQGIYDRLAHGHG
jgi:glycosyltransferase involved in cell wall biosynthesis